jgi:assimilatory nitrate reductase catalytic subunit
MGREAEIPHRHASVMASGAATSTTRPGLQPGGALKRTIRKPPPGLRTDLAVPAEPVHRFGKEESRRAPAGGMAENASVTWERVDAEDGGLRACPSVDRSATSRLLEKRIER